MNKEEAIEILMKMVCCRDMVNKRKCEDIGCDMCIYKYGYKEFRYATEFAYRYLITRGKYE